MNRGKLYQFEGRVDSIVAQAQRCRTLIEVIKSSDKALDSVVEDAFDAIVEADDQLEAVIDQIEDNLIEAGVRVPR